MSFGASTLAGGQLANTAGEQEPYLLVFQCGTGYFRTKGSLAGVTSGDVLAMSAASQIALAPGQGQQALETESSSTPEFASPDGPAASTLTATLQDTAVAPAEIRH